MLHDLTGGFRLQVGQDDLEQRQVQAGITQKLQRMSELFRIGGENIPLITLPGFATGEGVLVYRRLRNLVHIFLNQRHVRSLIRYTIPHTIEAFRHQEDVSKMRYTGAYFSPL